MVFLHTSPVHISRFNAILNALHYKHEVRHYVNEALLNTVLETGCLDKVGFKKQLDTIRKETHEVVLCTCSTYGTLTEGFDDVERIDYPLANYVVSHYQFVGVAYTVKSTLMVTMELLHAVADKNGKKVSCSMIDCTSAWPHFESGDLEAYDNEISNIISKESLNVDVVYLAQASMDGVERTLSDQLGKEVLSTPLFCVNAYLKS